MTASIVARQAVNDSPASPLMPSVLNLAGRFERLSQQLDEHLDQYQAGIDDLNVSQVSSAATMLEVDIALIMQHEKELNEAPEKESAEMVHARAAHQTLGKRFKKTLGIRVSLQQFQGESVAGNYSSGFWGRDAIDFLQLETVKNLQVIRDTLKMVELAQSETKLSKGQLIRLFKLFDTASGRPVNVQFKVAVLKKLSLWDRLLDSDWLFRQMFIKLNEKAHANAADFGSMTDVGNFSLEKADDKLTYKYAQYASPIYKDYVSDENALSVAKMIASAPRSGREAILKKLEKRGQLDKLLENLPWKVVEQFHDSIIDYDLREKLYKRFKDEGGGKSLNKMYTETADEYAEEGSWIKAGAVETGRRLHNILTFGFLDSYSEAYDLREAGLITDEALFNTGVLAAVRAAAGLAAGPLLGKLGQGLGVGAGALAKLSPEGAKLLGAVTGGAAAGAGTQLTTDLYNMAFMGQEEFSPGSSYITAAGVGGALGGLSGLRARAQTPQNPHPGDPNWAKNPRVIQGEGGSSSAQPQPKITNDVGASGTVNQGPYMGPGNEALKLNSQPAPVIATPKSHLTSVPESAPVQLPKSGAGGLSSGLQALIGMLGQVLGQSPGQATNPETDRDKPEQDEDDNRSPEIILNLPSQKAPYLSWYRSLIGTLVHQKNSPRPNDQADRWRSEMKGLVSRQHLARLAELGIEVHENCITVPNWSKQRDEVRMTVDHMIEVQVVPNNRMQEFHNIGNWELLDESSNSSSGPKLQSNIAAERKRLVRETGDVTWLEKPLHFTKVEAQPGPHGQRWTAEEIMDGDHFDVLIEHLEDRDRLGPSKPDKYGHCIRPKNRRKGKK